MTVSRSASHRTADLAKMREELHALADRVWRDAWREGIAPGAYTATLRIEGW